MVKWNQRAVLVGAVVTAVFLTGCAGLRQKPDVSLEAGEVQISGTEQASKQVMANIAKPYVSPLGEIPLDLTPLTEQWIRYFQGRGRRYMEVYLERSSRYLPMMKNTLREHGLPEDLVYVALIESGFSPLAHSHANAVGYWQFIRATGKRYGLTVDPFIDERRDPVLSTRAAAEYFKALYNLFGSWHLSLAAYNVGENRVQRAVMKHFTRDYWELIKKRKALPKETKHYVPKFIAAAMIAKDPEKYGFSNIAYQAPLAFDTVQLTNPVSMSKLAQLMNVSVEDMRLLNPKFRGDFVPQYRGAETMIRVPVGAAQTAVAMIPQAIAEQPKVLIADHYFYRVKRGDTLSTIARRHRTSIATIKRLNGLGSRTLLRVGQRLKVPDRGGSFVTYEMPATQGASTNEASEAFESFASGQNREPSEAVAPESHVVRRGENLSVIARKYGITVAKLRRLNKLSSRSVLRAGQTLRLRDDEPAVTNKSGAVQNTKRVVNGEPVLAKNKVKVRQGKRSAAKAAAPALIGRVRQQTKQIAANPKKAKRHIVRKGETLAQIAERYRVSIGAIAKKNQIKNRSQLIAGRELTIPH